jgi:hypothetical protein
VTNSACIAAWTPAAGASRCGRERRGAFAVMRRSVALVVAALVLALAVPSVAQADSSQGTQCQGALGIAADIATLNVKDLGSAVTCGLLQTLFPTTSISPTTSLVQSLVATPNYTQDGTNLAQVGKNTSAIGFGLLGATMTFAILQYWLSGLVKMDTGFAGAEGIARGVGVAIFIVLWPWGFGQIVAVTNSLAQAVVGSGVHASTDILPFLAVAAPFAIGAPAVGLIIGIIFFLLGAVLFAGLLALKMGLGVTEAVIYVAMPILASLSVMPSFAWLLRVVSKILVVILLIPVLWAIVFIVWTAFAADTVTFGNFTLHDAGVWGTLLRPLETVMLLGLMIFLPLRLARLAALSGLIPGNGAGMAGRAASSAMGRVTGGAIQAHLPPGLGGRAGQSGGNNQAGGGGQGGGNNRAGGGGQGASGGGDPFEDLDESGGGDQEEGFFGAGGGDPFEDLDDGNGEGQAGSSDGTQADSWRTPEFSGAPSPSEAVLDAGETVEAGNSNISAAGDAGNAADDIVDAEVVDTDGVSAESAGQAGDGAGPSPADGNAQGQAGDPEGAANGSPDDVRENNSDAGGQAGGAETPGQGGFATFDSADLEGGQAGTGDDPGASGQPGGTGELGAGDAQAPKQGGRSDGTDPGTDDLFGSGGAADGRGNDEGIEPETRGLGGSSSTQTAPPASADFSDPGPATPPPTDPTTP